MENFTFFSPTYFVFGKGEENNTGALIKRFGGSRVLIHYGGGSVVRSGLLDRVKSSLEKEDITYVIRSAANRDDFFNVVFVFIFLVFKVNLMSTDNSQDTRPCVST